MRNLALAFLFLVAATGLRAEENATFTVGAYKFSRPADWKWIEPTSSMRKAQLQIPGKDGGAPADVVFFFFGEGQGGGVQANVERWLGQFTDKKDAGQTEPLDVNGTKVTLVSTEGTMKASPFGGQPQDQPGSGLLGAIVEHPEGAVFVKMTGPAALVKQSREKFIAMVKAAAAAK
ncbi:MAG: hypothetical protein ABMA01_20215 [Chthoniobacteraceae bacterium]